MKKVILFQLSFFILFLIGCANHQKQVGVDLEIPPVKGCKTLPRLKSDGKFIINDKGEKINLRGCNLGNWLCLEMWMMCQESEGVDDQHSMENKLTERFGEEKKDELMNVFRHHWITERDFEIVKSFDMNVVRLPFEYRLLEDDDNPYKLRDGAFQWLDRTVQLAEQNGLYVILDLHGAAGRQSGMDHTGRRDYNKLWTEKENQDRTVWLWKEIAKRYADCSSIAAYDVLNEPWGGTAEELRDLVFRLYDEIRKVDRDHIIIFPGYYSGIDAYGDPKEHGQTNVMFTMHFYPGFFGWGRPTSETHARFIYDGMQEWIDRIDGLDTPFFVGEFNVVLKDAGGGEMMRRYFDKYNGNGWAATMWSYKVFTKPGGIGRGVWGMVTNKDPLPEVDLNNWSYEEIDNWFRSLSSMEYAIDDDLKYWMTTEKELPILPEPPPPPPPVKVSPYNDELPEGWLAIDIGNSLAGGQKVDNPTSMTIWGGGDDIWNEKDQYRFVYQEIKGDFTLSVRVNSIKYVHNYSKAGLMIRESLDADSPHVLINSFPDGSMELGYRLQAGDTMKADSQQFGEYPDIYLKIERKGNEILASYSFDKNEWHNAETKILKGLRKSVYAGLATLSHDNSQLVNASYSEIEIKK